MAFGYRVLVGILISLIWKMQRIFKSVHSFERQGTNEMGTKQRERDKKNALY